MLASLVLHRAEAAPLFMNALGNEKRKKRNDSLYRPIELLEVDPGLPQLVCVAPQKDTRRREAVRRVRRVFFILLLYFFAVLICKRIVPIVPKTSFSLSPFVAIEHNVLRDNLVQCRGGNG